MRRTAQRRREIILAGQSEELQRSLIDAMRAPAVFSTLGKPNSARPAPSTSLLATKLEGLVKHPIREPPPPGLLLTPRLPRPRSLTPR